MWTYAIRALSPFIYTPEVIQPLLMCGLLPQTLFPIRFLTQPVGSEHIVLNTPSEFSTSLIDATFYKDDYLRVPLYAVNGSEFTFSVKKDNLYLHETVVAVLFTQEPLEAGLLTLDALKQTIVDMAKVINIGYANVYDTTILKYRRLQSYYGPPGEKAYPLEIGWIAYFAPPLVDFLGRERFDNFKTYHEKIEVNGGILVVLTEEPFDASNPEHREREAQAIAELGLDKLSTMTKAGATALEARRKRLAQQGDKKKN